MRYAIVRRDAQKVLKKGHLFWYPMIEIRYRVGDRVFDKLFDAVLYRKVSLHALPLLIRDPRDYSWSERPCVEGIVIPPAIADPQTVFDDLKLFYSRLVEMRKSIHEKVGRSPLTQMAGLIVPAVHYLTMRPVDQLWYVENAIKVLELLGFGQEDVPVALSGEIVYVPVVVSKDLSEAYEPALKKERSESLTWLLQDKRCKKFFEALLGGG